MNLLNTQVTQITKTQSRTHADTLRPHDDKTLPAVHAEPLVDVQVRQLHEQIPHFPLSSRNTECGVLVLLRKLDLNNQAILLQIAGRQKNCNYKKYKLVVIIVSVCLNKHLTSKSKLILCKGKKLKLVLCKEQVNHIR